MTRTIGIDKSRTMKSSYSVGHRWGVRSYWKLWSIFMHEKENGPKHIPAELNAGVMLAPKARQKEPEVS